MCTFLFSCDLACERTRGDSAGWVLGQSPHRHCPSCQVSLGGSLPRGRAPPPEAMGHGLDPEVTFSSSISSSLYH